MLSPSFRPSRHLPDLVDNFFGQNLPDNFFGDSSWENTPSVNIIETDSDFKVEVAAPGLEKEDFKINMNPNMLTISAEKEHRKERKEGENYIRHEFSYTSFSRSLSLSNSVEQEKIIASHKNGVLTVVLPKKEEFRDSQSRIIEIS